MNKQAKYIGPHQTQRNGLESKRLTLQLGDGLCSTSANAFQCETPKQSCFVEEVRRPPFLVLNFERKSKSFKLEIRKGNN